MENSSSQTQNPFLITHANHFRIAVLNGKTIRKFINHCKKNGAIIQIDRHNHKLITDVEGLKIFSALKYSTGWDCRIAEQFVGELKSIIG